MTMTSIQTPQPSVDSPPPRGRLYWAIADSLTMTKRNLIGYTHVPEAIFFSSVQPIMFFCCSVTCSVGAIPTPGYHYVQFLMPGIFVQTVAFGSIGASMASPKTCTRDSSSAFRRCRCRGGRCSPAGPRPTCAGTSS